jgi:hypothetical protein
MKNKKANSLSQKQGNISALFYLLSILLVFNGVHIQT